MHTPSHTRLREVYEHGRFDGHTGQRDRREDYVNRPAGEFAAYVDGYLDGHRAAPRVA